MSGQAMDASFGEAVVVLATAAAQLLGWRPDEFWSATPAEFETALGCAAAEPGPDLDRIAALRQRFPDD